jgi:hypothetical protein
MDLIYEAMTSDLVRALRAGGPDANGQPPERGAISGGQGTPCRHCLDQVPEGAEYLILAHRPFPALQPYAECGPIFLCAVDCPRWDGAAPPPVLKSSTSYLLKAYSADHRIRYGSGRIVPQDAVIAYAATLLEDLEAAFVDIRSAVNNCFLLRIRRRVI